MKKKYLSLPLEVKSFEQNGLITGYASVFNIVDFHNDILAPGAFFKTIKAGQLCNIKLLWQHRIDEPIGVITHLEEDDYGLYIEAKLLLNIAKASEAYSLVKTGSVRGLSIGYYPKEFFYNENNTRTITEVELKEISLVTFPANNEAGILYYKNIDFSLLTNNIEKAIQILN